MVEKQDIESLLRTGSWRTWRSWSRDPHESHRRPYEPPSPKDGAAGKTVEPASRSRRPPPPTVEDEEEALAKEYQGGIASGASDEEPKYRGEIDQQPILIPVHEHNPERRFVIVPGAAGQDNSSTNRARYEANTCRKYVLVSPDKKPEGTGHEKENSKRPDLPKRKSHQDLPRIKTDFSHDESFIRESSSRRGREKIIVDRESRESSSNRGREHARPPDSTYLSPTVPHTAGGRDRAYWDFQPEALRGSSRSASTRRDAEVEVPNGRRSYHSASGYKSSPPARQTSRDGPTLEGPRPSNQPYGFGNPDEILAYMAPGDDFMAGRREKDDSPSRRTRDDGFPPHPRGAREMPGPSPRRRRKPRSEPRERDDGYSSDDSYREKRPSRAGRPYPTRPTLEPDYPPLFSPDQARQPSPKVGVPIPSPGATLSGKLRDVSPPPNSRSATFPSDRTRRAGERPLSPSPPTSTSPSRRAPQDSRLRRGSISSVSNGGSASTLPPIPSSLGRDNAMESRASEEPATSATREDSSEPNSPVLYWEAGHPDEQADADYDVQNEVIARLPDCRWKHPTVARSRASSIQFFTLKHAENFAICSDCYDAVFANTEFHHLFVPAPVRSGGQLISCDFGASPWYRIAYALTLKHGHPDLRLLQGIASVAARSQACAGGQLATRIWYGIMSPNLRRPIQTFNVCLSCARMVEVLLPNLAGVFVPLDGHEPTRGICDLHFAPERKRFFTYFRQMEDTSLRALRRRTAPDLAELGDRIRDISLHDECLRNTPVPNRKWHVLKQIPEFTVCEECFDAVVWPRLEGGDDSEIPLNFYKYRQPRPLAACQLYSERMRKVFRLACEYNDFEYLESCVLERMAALAEIRARYNELQREDPDDPDVLQELAALAKRFKEVE